MVPASCDVPTPPNKGVSNMIENIRTEKYKIAVRNYLPDGRIHTVVGIDTYSIGDANSNIANCKYWDHKLADIGLADYWLIPAS